MLDFLIMVIPKGEKLFIKFNKIYVRIIPRYTPFNV